jgi:hypothetical protein
MVVVMAQTFGDEPLLLLPVLKTRRNLAADEVVWIGYDKGPERPFAVWERSGEFQNGGSLPLGGVKSSSGQVRRCCR